MSSCEHISDYTVWITSLKSKIKSARIKVALSVNSQLIALYWEIGKDLSKKAKNAGWGSGIIEQISIDLKHEFPEMKGFSRRNLYAVKQWYEFYHHSFEFVPQPVAQIPWGHNRLIVSRTSSTNEAIFYCQKTIGNGWSREVLDVQLDKKLFARNAQSTHNFENTLPEYQSKIAILLLASSNALYYSNSIQHSLQLHL